MIQKDKCPFWALGTGDAVSDTWVPESVWNESG